jgi:hypothetical protein
MPGLALPGGLNARREKTGMIKSLHRAVRPALRFAGLGVGLALLLGACGEQAPEGEQQQGSVSPPAVTDQLNPQATS